MTKITVCTFTVVVSTLLSDAFHKTQLTTHVFGHVLGAMEHVLTHGSCPQIENSYRPTRGPNCG